MSPEEKAKSLIQANLKATLPNIESYESISYGSLEKANINYYTTLEAFELDKRWKALHKEANRLNEKAKMDIEWLNLRRDDSASQYYNEYEIKVRKILDEMHAISDSLRSREEKFSFDSTMVCMSHRYRYYDEARKQHVIIPIIYYFDSSITKIKGMSLLENGDSGVLIYCDVDSMVAWALRHQ